MSNPRFVFSNVTKAFLNKGGYKRKRQMKIISPCHVPLRNCGCCPRQTFQDSQVNYVFEHYVLTLRPWNIFVSHYFYALMKSCQLTFMSFRRLFRIMTLFFMFCPFSFTFKFVGTTMLLLDELSWNDYNDELC